MGVPSRSVDPQEHNWERLPDWASLELSPSVESCGCGLGPSPVSPLRLGTPISYAPVSPRIHI